MDEKEKSLQNDFESLNPRHRIQQAILPRLERTRELYSQEPDLYTRKGKRVLKKPNLDDSFINHIPSDYYGISKYNYPTQSLNRTFKRRELINEQTKSLKPIIHTTSEEINSNLSKLKLSSGQEFKKSVNFNDDITYSATNNA